MNKSPKKFKPTCAWIKKEMTAAKAAASRWYSLGSGAVGAPQSKTGSGFYSPMMKKVKQKADDLVLYAAALGQKQGLLPVDMSEWSGSAWWEGDNGVVTFSLPGPWNPVKIPVRFLEWSPAAAIEETIEDEPAVEQFLLAA